MKSMLDEYNWSDGVLQVITERMKQLEKIISCKKASLQQPCEGKLRVQKRKNSYQYFLRTDPKDTNGKYLPIEKRHIAIRIAQRDYDERIVYAAEKELKAAAAYVEVLKHDSVADVFESLNSGKQAIVTPVIMPAKQFADSWEKVEYERMPLRDDIDFCSGKGVRVRSKSELIIANMLEHYKIPYRYEYPIILKNIGTVRPDFLCLNIRTRQEYIWEHFGMMDNISYSNKNIAKIGAYEQSGYYPGINLIMTFETSQYALSSKTIKEMIEQYLL